MFKKNLNKNSSTLHCWRLCHILQDKFSTVQALIWNCNLFIEFHIEFLEFPSILSIHPIHEFDMVVESPLKKHARQMKIISPSRGTKHIYTNLWETNTKVVSWKRRPAPNSSSKKNMSKKSVFVNPCFQLATKTYSLVQKTTKKTCQPTTWRVQFFGGQTMINVQPTKKALNVSRIDISKD